MENGSNRRQSTRYEVTIEVELEVPAIELQKTVVTRDLSKGGVCFTLDRELSLGEDVLFELSLVLGPDTFSQPLDMKGTVAWCAAEDQGEFQIGAAFTNLDDDKSENIATFLEFIREGFEYKDTP